MIIPKDKDPILDQKFFDLLFPIIFPDEYKDPVIYKFAKEKLSIEMQLLSTSNLLEQAISSAKGLTRHATVGRDFVDGSDAKSSSVRWASKNTVYSAPITDVYNKRGLLRCVIYERLQDKFYFFLIPHRAYSHISKTSNIDIPFELDGTPRRNSKFVRNVDWWQFEVPDFAGILSDTANLFETATEKKNRVLQESFNQTMQWLEQQSKRKNISSPMFDFAQPTKIDSTQQTPILCNEDSVRSEIQDPAEKQPISLCD